MRHRPSEGFTSWVSAVGCSKGESFVRMNDLTYVLCLNIGAGSPESLDHYLCCSSVCREMNK